MNYSHCGNCGSRFLIPRIFCPECNSTAIATSEITSGTVIHCVKLIATPEPYPDEYYTIYAEYEGVKFFCRSSEELTPGTKVQVEDTESGIVCSSF